MCRWLFILWISAISPLIAQSEAKLNWKSSYEEGKAESKATSKPLILFFTGSDWCGYCHKLEKEVLNTPEFGELVGKQFVFVTIDFPMYKPTPEENKVLQKKYDIKGYPTLVIFDSDGQKIGTIGYQLGGAKPYAEHLLKMVQEHSQYKKKVSAVDSSQSSPQELKELYLKAKELGASTDAATLLARGLSSSDKGFFLMERFRAQAQEGLIHTTQAQATKQEILSLDPYNKAHSQYELALIEFEAYSEEMSQEVGSTEMAVQPLLEYIEHYGSGDKENVWKLQMIISQAFLDKNKFQEALDFARASYETAPDPIKSEIATAVRNLQIEIKK
jgi:protein disulfide-isomerase